MARVPHFDKTNEISKETNVAGLLANMEQESEGKDFSKQAGIEEDVLVVDDEVSNENAEIPTDVETSNQDVSKTEISETFEEKSKEVKEEKFKPKQTAPVQNFNDAANLIIKALPTHVQVAVEHQANTIGVDLWQYFCGLINYCHEAAVLSCPVLDPAWHKGNGSSYKSEDICAYCQNKFTPKYRGQIYCSNECGLAIEEKEREKRIQADKKRAAMDLKRRQERALMGLDSPVEDEDEVPL